MPQQINYHHAGVPPVFRQCSWTSLSGGGGVFSIQDWRRHGVLPPSSYPKHSIKVVSAKLLYCNGGARGLTVSAVGTPPHSPGEFKFTESIPSLAHEPTINPDWRIMYAVGGEWGFARLETQSVLFTPSTTETLCILILPIFFFRTLSIIQLTKKHLYGFDRFLRIRKNLYYTP